MMPAKIDAFLANIRTRPEFVAAARVAAARTILEDGDPQPARHDLPLTPGLVVVINERAMAPPIEIKPVAAIAAPAAVSTED